MSEIEINDLKDGAFAFQGNEILTFCANGQSTANGCTRGPGLSLQPVRPNRVGMLSSGIRILGNNQNHLCLTEAVAPAALAAGFVDAREIGHPSAGETGWAMAGRRMTEPGQLPPTTAALVGTVAVGRADFEETAPGSIPYDNLLRWHRRARQLAHREGKSFRIGGIFWCGYESSVRMSQEAILLHYRQMAAACESDLRPMNDAPSQPLFVITDQVASSGFYDTRRDGMLSVLYGHAASQPLAALQAALEIPGVILACPRYFIDHDRKDQVHLTDAAGALRGEYFARVAVRALKGQSTLPLHIAASRRDGDRIVLTYHVPDGPLRIDPDGPVSDPGEFGFEWRGDGAIESVTVTGPDQLTIDLSTAAPGELRYAMQVLGLNTGPRTGPRGCVCDSSQDVSAYGVRMTNWAAVQRVMVA
jgi:hypothetical protein